MTAFVLATAAVAEAKGPSVQVRTSEAIVATWTCQDKIPEGRSRARSPWKRHSKGFRAAQLNLWKFRLKDCLERLHSHDEVLRRLRVGMATYYRSQGVRVGPMSGHERELEAVARRYGWSPFFIFAASITESSGGLAACRSNHFNVWGLASCGSWNGVAPAVGNSWTQAFDYYARFLIGHWPSASSTYSFGGYAACSSCWGEHTAAHMRRYFGVGNGVRYA